MESRNDFINEDQIIISSLIKKNGKKAQVDSFFKYGLYNLALETIVINTYSDEDKVEFANKFIDYGEFDKGQYLVSNINSISNQTDVIFIKLRCALNKQDNVLSQILLDSLIKSGLDTTDMSNKVGLLLYEAYLKHNQHQYKTSIYLNLEAIKLINKYNLQQKYLATAYRRIANDYNDIVRNKIAHSESQKICFKKALWYYKNELNILIKEKQIDKNRIALNNLTTALLLRSFQLDDKIENYYLKSINDLIVFNDSNFIITRNPIYTSIALTQLAEYYYTSGRHEKIDSLLTLNKKLLNVRSFYKVNNKQSLDLWEYFPQRIQELKLISMFNASDKQQKSETLLNLSNANKYVNQSLNLYLNDVFMDKVNTAIKNWILYNELFVYHKINNSTSIINSGISERFKYYNERIAEVVTKNHSRITTKDIEYIKQICKERQATFIDYQLLSNYTLLITKINQDDITYEWIKPENSLSMELINLCLKAAFDNDIELYEEAAFKIASKLKLNNIKTNNIIICSDEYLEKIPFDALVLYPSQSKTWSGLNFLAKNHQIEQIPSLGTLLNQNELTSELKIDIWTSETDNKTLPYNQHLISFLKKEFGANVNSNKQANILHVLAHTYRTIENNIEFRLDEDTLTCFSSNVAKPKLTILEGCNSGEGKNIKLEGSLSQTRSFLYTGSQSVVYALWDADNYASTELFKSYYKHLAEGKDVFTALKLAKNTIITDFAHPEWANPYYWANFQIMGKRLSFIN